MYDLGDYPGVILTQDGPDSGHDVVGEVYAIEPALERKLDEIEMLYPAQTDEYCKQEVAVAIGSRLLACLVYAINPAYVKNRRLVPGGDWLKG